MYYKCVAFNTSDTTIGYGNTMSISRSMSSPVLSSVLVFATDVVQCLSSGLLLFTIHLKFSTFLVPKYCDSTRV